MSDLVMQGGLSDVQVNVILIVRRKVNINMDTNMVCQITEQLTKNMCLCKCNCGSADITNWLTSFGTVGAVIVAVAVPLIKKIVFSPKVKLEMGACSPYYTIGAEESADESNIGKRVVGSIWVGAKNMRGFAGHCFICLNAIYINKGSDTDIKKYKFYRKFHPQILRWDVQQEKDNKSFIDIPSSMTYFAKVASIALPRSGELTDAASTSKGVAPCPRFASIEVAASDGDKVVCPIIGTCQDILLSVRVSGCGLKGVRNFLKINWTGKSEEDIQHPAQHLNVHVLSNAEGLAIINEPEKEVL